MRKQGWCAVTSLLFLLCGCPIDSTSSNTNQTPASNDNQAGTTNDNEEETPDAPSTTVVQVGSDGNTFTPADVTINMGDTVRWEWAAGEHNVVAGTYDVLEPEIFDSGDPTSDTSTVFEVTFDEAFLEANPKEGDVYDYVCEVHPPNMVGTVTVVAD